MITLAVILILSIPTAYELWRERKGEKPEHKIQSTKVRAQLIVICAAIANCISGPRFIPWVTSEHLWPLMVAYSKFIFMSFAIFFLVFDYCINLILGRKPWFKYLSNSPLDLLWKSLDWRVRLAIRVLVFMGSLIWFYV